MDESDECLALDESDKKEDLRFHTKFRAVRKFPSKSGVFHGQNDDKEKGDVEERCDDGDDDLSSETSLNCDEEDEHKAGDSCEDDDDDDDVDDEEEEEGEYEDSDEDYVKDEDEDDVSVEFGETCAKKLKLAEDAKTLKNIFFTEDFINFLCYRNYREPENADEQRKVVTEFFKEETLNKYDAPLRPTTDFTKKSKQVAEEQSTTQHKSGNSSESATKKKFSIDKKSTKTSSSPNKKSTKPPLDDTPSLKNRLRPSTKALTAATDKEQLLNVRRKLSRELKLCKSSESSSDKEVESLPGSAESSEGTPKDDPGPNKTCYKCKSIAPISATTSDFSDVHAYIARLIATRNQPAFLLQPPSSFKIECNIPQHVRFSTHNQYVHRFCNRWGRNSVKLACIMCFLVSNGTGFTSHPLAGGVEMDLVGLSDSICSHGGLQRVLDDVLWADVIKTIRVPKMTRDKISRFYEVYCRYLLSYDSLTSKEKEKLERKVLNCSNSECCDDLCVAKGRCRTLSELYDVACNIASMFDLDDASSQQVLSAYWKIVEDANPHVTVHTAFMKPDTSRRRSSAKKKMNLTSFLRCCCSPSCPLSCDEEVLDSRLEVEMMFSTRCWTMDRHSRGTVSYNYTGADINWYFVSFQDEKKLKKALKEIVPDLIQQTSGYWLPPNIAMVHPEMLMKRGVPVHQVVQQAGQLVVIPPNTFFASISCGYNISEHIHFLPQNWLINASKASNNLHRSCIEAIFSFERFVFLMLSVECFQHQHQQQDLNTVQHFSPKDMIQALSVAEKFVSRELRLRKALIDLGVRRRVVRVSAGEDGGSEAWVDKVVKHELGVCHLTKDFCFFSVVKELHTNDEYCLGCAIKMLLKKKAQRSSCELVIHFKQSELSEVLSKAKNIWRHQML